MSLFTLMRHSIPILPSTSPQIRGCTLGRMQYINARFSAFDSLLETNKRVFLDLQEIYVIEDTFIHYFYYWQFYFTLPTFEVEGSISQNLSIYVLY